MGDPRHAQSARTDPQQDPGVAFGLTYCRSQKNERKPIAQSR
jgi:hypothetical protein